MNGIIGVILGLVLGLFIGGLTCTLFTLFLFWKAAKDDPIEFLKMWKNTIPVNKVEEYLNERIKDNTP